MFKQFSLKKVILYLVALILLGTSVALIQSTNLGMSAWDAFHRNFYEGVPIEYKWLNPISALVFVSIAYLIEKKKPAWIMLFPILISFTIGAIIDFELLWIPSVIDAPFYMNYLYLLIAIVLVAIGLNLMIYSTFPLPALDQFCMSFTKRFHLSFGQGKYIGEFLALLGTVVVGLSFQSQEDYFYLGITTIFYLFFLGFVIDWFRNPLLRRINAIPRLSIYTDDLTENDQSLAKRVSARAVIMKDNLLLLLHLKAHDIYLLPGGGVLKGERLSRTVKREVLEETGYRVSVKHETVIIDEFFLEKTFENHYFIATIKGKPHPEQINWTKEERDAKIALRWVPVEEALQLLNDTDTSHPEGMHMMYREFLGIMNSL